MALQYLACYCVLQGCGPQHACGAYAGGWVEQCMCACKAYLMGRSPQSSAISDGSAACTSVAALRARVPLMGVMLLGRGMRLLRGAETPERGANCPLASHLWAHPVLMPCTGRE